MPNGQITFMPPPQIGGVSQPPSPDGLMRQLATMMNGGDEPQAELAGPMLMQGMMMMQQAATLDPRIAPLVQRALSVLQGGAGAPPLPKGASRSSTHPEPGGTLSSY